MQSVQKRIKLQMRCNSKSAFHLIVSAVFLNLTVTMMALTGTTQEAGSTWKANVKAGDCAGCHVEKVKLPESHPATKDMSLSDCKQCHSGKTRLYSKLRLSHFHNLSGVKCTDCHAAKSKTKAVTKEKCLTCHKSYEDLVSLTADADPNPHESHLGELDCSYCHHQHKRSENYCAQCHEWPLDLP
jgi:hypothetical protein